MIYYNDLPLDDEILKALGELKIDYISLKKCDQLLIVFLDRLFPHDDHPSGDLIAKLYSK